MIDLNHLLKNISIYKEKYAEKEVRANLETIVSLEDSRKELQLKTEKMRALCNKLASEVPSFRENNKDTDELISQIKALDEQIKTNNKKLNSLNNSINKKLKKLHNLPEFSNKFNEQMTTTFTGVTINDLKALVEQKFNVNTFNGSIKTYFKTNRNILLQEDSMPVVTKCRDGYLFLGSEILATEIKEFFLNYFLNNAFSVIKVSCRKLNKENNSSFYIHLNKRESFYFEINKEYYSREFNIKYRNSKIDMTKFVNQVNILFKW